MNPSTEHTYPALTEALYDELRRLAAWYIRQERPDHTLQPTALVNEAFVRLAQTQTPTPTSKNQFMGLAARVMRHVLVEHARASAAKKRGGPGLEGEGPVAVRIALNPDDSPLISSELCAGVDLLALNEALEALAKVSDRQARVVEARFFAGLNVEQTAEMLGVSPRTVEADWRFARAWLRRELELSNRS